MTGRRLAVLAMVGVVLAAAPQAWADYYDTFDNGTYGPVDPNYLDPNDFDVDDPCWSVIDIFSSGDHSMSEGWLQLDCNGFFGFGLIGASVHYGDEDPNTSETYWDGGTDHYIMARFRNGNWHTDPNDDGGIALLTLHGNFIENRIIYLHYEFKDDVPWNGARFAIKTLSGAPLQYGEIDGTFIRGADPNSYDPADPNWADPNNMWATPGYLDEHNGIWMVFQFTTDGSDPNDPNGKRLKAACWDGDKYDWDGTWDLDKDLGTVDGNDPNLTLYPGSGPFPWWPALYWKGGISTVAAYTAPEEGNKAVVQFDHVEARTGVFDNDAKRLDLEIKNSKYGQVEIEPDLADPNDTYDPNLVDPNDGLTFPQGRLLRYTTGTEVVLVAEPMVDRSFKSWTVYDPNFPGDGNYVTLDTNAVLYLTMDADYQVEALFNCGSGVPPFVAMTLLALGLGVVIRRMV